MSHPPVRICCGQPHFGPVCPDNKVMCCLCFRRVEFSELNVVDGRPEDVCLTCAEKEKNHRAPATQASGSIPKMKQTLQPLGDRVLVQRAESQTATAGGILLPDVSVEAPQEGTVIALGLGEHPFKVKVGDTVLLPRYGGIETKLNGDKYLLVQEVDILGILGKTADEIPVSPEGVVLDGLPESELSEANPPPGAMPRTVADDDLDEPLGTPQTCTDDVCESCQ